jgi:hypothetical protein
MFSSSGVFLVSSDLGGTGAFLNSLVVSPSHSKAIAAQCLDQAEQETDDSGCKPAAQSARKCPPEIPAKDLPRVSRESCCHPNPFRTPICLGRHSVVTLPGDAT